MARIPKYPLPGVTRSSVSIHPLDIHRGRLGTVPDATVAEASGLSPERVKAYRRAHGIPPFQRGSAGAPNPAEPAMAPAKGPARATGALAGALQPYVDLLGAVPDALVAGIAGVSVGVARAQRIARGLREFQVPDLNHPDSPTVSRASKLRAFAPLIGKMPDDRVAQLSGASLSGVQAYRLRHRIARWSPVPTPNIPDGLADAPLQRRRRASRIDPFKHLVGVLFDSEVARMAGVTTGGVQQYRRAHKISAAAAAKTRTAAHDPGAETSAHPPTHPTSTPAGRAALAAPGAGSRARTDEHAPARAFRVSASLSGVVHRFFVLGADIGAASAQAVARLGARRGEVWSIRWIREVGEAL